MAEPLVCEGCGRVFPSVFELRRHQYGHDKGCLREPSSMRTYSLDEIIAEFGFTQAEIDAADD